MAGPTTVQTSRRRPAPAGDEEATARLKLGNMTHEQALSPAEVLLMLERIEEHAGEHRNTTEIYYKTKEYCKTFSRFKDANAVTQVNQISTGLTARGIGIVEFERAQLATLCCDSPEEARTLIPSLEGKISDDELQTVLDEISKLRDFS